MKDQETQSLVHFQKTQLASSVAQTHMESRWSFCKFVISSICFVCIVWYATIQLDKSENLEDKLKVAWLYINVMLIFMGYVFLPAPNYSGFARYFFKLIQSIAFTYVVNVIFMSLLVYLLGS